MARHSRSTIAAVAAMPMRCPAARGVRCSHAMVNAAHTSTSREASMPATMKSAMPGTPTPWRAPNHEPIAA
jgi:hypothetical protein